MTIDVDSCEVCKRMVNTNEVTSALQCRSTARNTDVHEIVTVHKRCRKDVVEWRPEKCSCGMLHTELKLARCRCMFHELNF